MNCQPITHAEPPAAGSSTVRLTAVALALLTLAVFGRTLWNGFVDLDDNAYVYENPEVAAGLTFKGLIHAFTRGSMNNWDPLTTISHMVDCQIYGLHPWGHHLTNLLLHTASVVLLFLVLRQMTGALWRSAFAAALFAVHPQHVESVAWIAERKDVLSGLFFMLTVWAYVRYVRRPRTGAYVPVLVFFALGLMSKAMLVTVPFLLLLLDWWPLSRFHQPLAARHLLLEKIPLAGLSLLSALAAFLAQGHSVLSLENLPLAPRVFNALISYASYLGQMIWPAGLAVYYPYPTLGLPNWEIILSMAVLAGISAMAWRWRCEIPYLLVGWLWYLVMLVPVIGLLQIGAQARADRYTYLPQIGLYVAGSWLAGSLWTKRPVLRAWLGAGAAVAIAALSAISVVQAGYWFDGERLWLHTIASTSENWFACNNLGTVLLKKGRVDDAITQYRIVLSSRPDDPMAHYNLGDAYTQQGHTEQAVAEYQLALRSNPDDAQAHSKMGTLLAQQGRLEEAATHLAESARLDPSDASTLYKLGTVRLQTGHPDTAIGPLEQAVSLQPDFAAAQNNLGNSLLQIGRPDTAIMHFQKMTALQPGNAAAHNNLGTALFRCGRVDEAVTQFLKALELQPDLAVAQNNLGQAAWLLAACPDAAARNGPRAVELAQQVVNLSGSNNAAHLATLGAALAETGRFPEAIAEAERARQLGLQQGNVPLVHVVESQLALYHAGRPFRDAGLTKSAAPR